MERNDNMSGLNAAGTGQSGMGGTTGSGDFGGSMGGGATGGAMSGSSDFGGSSVGSAAGSQGLGEKAGNAADMAGDKLKDAKSAAGDKLGVLKEKASNLSATLADRLEAGAEKLRQRGGANQFAAVGGETATASQDQMSALTNRLAGGMQGTADILRNGDLKGTVETQVRENPARTLLIAVGLGYLLGKALKK